MYIEKLAGMFPVYLAPDAKIIESTLDLSAKHQSYIPFKVNLDRDIVTLPTRIYVDSNQLNKINNLSEIQKEMAYCFFSRHHDGFVREKCLKEFVTSNNLFAAPYIVQLLGEYVIEIIDIIYKNWDLINKNNILSFISENPLYFEKTQQRVYSYWDCFYRHAYPRYKRSQGNKRSHMDYPGIKVLQLINKLTKNEFGV